MFFNTYNLRNLDLPQIIKKAPAVAAQRPKESLSDKYLFVPTDKIVKGLLDNGWICVSAQQQRSTLSASKDYNHHALMFCRHDSFAELGQLGKGEVIPMLRIDNSHNGLSCFVITAALYRKVCANGLTVPDTMLAAPKVKHLISIDKDVVEASYRVIDDFPRLINQVNQFSSIQLSQQEKLILAKSASLLAFDKDRLEQSDGMTKTTVAERLLTAHRQKDVKDDLWTTTNVIQENIIRGGIGMITPNGKSYNKVKAVKSLDRDKSINQGLLTLAQEMAKLKMAA